MAIFNGSIFGRARNSIGGITFLKSQGREGTLQTARQRVKPSDPQTTPQMSQRDRMRYVVDVQKLVETSNLKPQWDYAISKLPAYQSFISYLLQSMVRSVPNPALGAFLPTVGQGRLHLPESIVKGENPGGGQIIEFSTENGNNGRQTDVLHTLLIGASPEPSNMEPVFVRIRPTFLRSEGRSRAFGDPPLITYDAGIIICYLTSAENSGIESYSKIFAKRFTST